MGNIKNDVTQVPTLCTVGIRNPNVSGFCMVEKTVGFGMVRILNGLYHRYLKCVSQMPKKSQLFENPTKKPGFQMVKSKIASKKTQPFENWTKLSGIKRVRVKQPLKWNRVRRGGQVNPNFEWRHLRMIPYLVRRWSDIAVEEFFEKL